MCDLLSPLCSLAFAPQDTAFPFRWLIRLSILTCQKGNPWFVMKTCSSLMSPTTVQDYALESSLTLFYNPHPCLRNSCVFYFSHIILDLAVSYHWHCYNPNLHDITTYIEFCSSLLTCLLALILVTQAYSLYCFQIYPLNTWLMMPLSCLDLT